MALLFFLLFVACHAKEKLVSSETNSHLVKLIPMMLYHLTSHFPNHLLYSVIVFVADLTTKPFDEVRLNNLQSWVG